MTDQKHAYVVLVLEASSGRTDPVRAVRAVFTDAWSAIEWVGEQFPNLVIQQVAGPQLAEGVVYVGEQHGVAHATVLHMPVQ